MIRLSFWILIFLLHTAILEHGKSLRLTQDIDDTGALQYDPDELHYQVGGEFEDEEFQDNSPLLKPTKPALSKQESEKPNQEPKKEAEIPRQGNANPPQEISPHLTSKGEATNVRTEVRQGNATSTSNVIVNAGCGASDQGFDCSSEYESTEPSDTQVPHLGYDKIPEIRGPPRINWDIGAEEAHEEVANLVPRSEQRQMMQQAEQMHMMPQAEQMVESGYNGYNYDYDYDYD